MKLLPLFLLLLGIYAHPSDATQDAAARNNSPVDGYVYVNMPRGDAKQSIKIKSVSENKEYQLAVRNDSGIFAYGAWVPEGRYQLSSLNNERLLGYEDITVKARTFTDLGSLMPFDIGQFQFVVLPIQNKESKDYANMAISGLKDNLELGASLQWLPQSLPSPLSQPLKIYGVPLIDITNAQYRSLNTPQARMTLRNTKTIPEFLRAYQSTAAPTSETPFVDKVGTSYYGADFGQIRLRKPDGIWSSLDTQSVLPVESVTVDDHFIAAAFKNGMIKISMDEGQTWSRHDLPQQDLEFIHILHENQRWLITTSKRLPAPKNKDTRFDIRVYTASMSDLADLNEIKKMDLPTQNNLVQNVKVVSRGNDYYVGTFPKLQRLSLDTMRWTDIAIPMDILTFGVSKNTGMITAVTPTSAWKTKVLISSDNGLTWDKLAGPPPAVLYTYFDDKASGTAARKKYKYMDSVLEIWKYLPTKDEWELLSSPPNDCERVLLDANDQPSFCITSSTRIAGSKNNKWSTVFYAE